MIILSHYQATPLSEAHQQGLNTLSISPDLNLTEVLVRLDDNGAHFPAGEIIGWQAVEEIAASPNKCYRLEGDTMAEIRVFSDTTGWVRSLYPTSNAPTVLVSGLTMHRIEGCDPYEDTLEKVKAARPSGVVLDTATGLGYTAIEAANQAERVITVEVDPAGLEIARLNPWSQGLFENPRIETVIADVWDYVAESEPELFSCVIHDPPAFRLAGDLYAGDFYAELFRVLKPRGRVFHYIGDPTSKSVQSVQRGVVDRLRRAGFSRVEPKPRAFGVVAYK